MSIKDLDLILKKDPIIATWPARSLCDTPETVEEDYLVHARTHLSLGDTSKYVETAFKWVSGQNKGAFIGAVLGRYGEGKTSFLVHLWAQSQEANVFTIPPFEWSAFESIADAISGWIRYVLRDTRPALAKRMQRTYEKFQQRTFEQRARATAKRTGKDYESVLETLQALVDSGDMQLTGMSAARLLDLVAEATEIVREAGYKGLLILLDEPEVAAKKLSNESVQHFLFDLSNELHRRQGNYGVFVSMPDNFFASAQRRFSALPARLEARKCFPRLGDIYGLGFAEDLWNRYVKEFDLGKEGRGLVMPLTLQGIGQVGSSTNKHLSYGPRSVVSAFSRMVERYREKNAPYRPQDFVQDVLDEEILVKPKYRSELLGVLRSPDVADESREAIKVLAAFPSGLRTETLQELGLEEVLRPLARPDGLVRRTISSMGLRALRSGAEGEGRASPVEDMIYESDSEYAPDRRAFENALSAFAKDVIPLIFKDREGQQLLGWQTLQTMELVNGACLGAKMGAFQQTVRQYPNRAILVLVNSLGAPFERIKKPELDKESGPTDYDFLFHFALKWHMEQDMPAECPEVREPRSQDKGILVRFHFDLTKGVVEYDNLAELVGQHRMTPLWVLNLLERMRGVDLDREFEAQWASIRRTLLRRLLGLLFGASFSESVARTTQEKLEERPTGSGIALVGSIASILLHRRYPDYNTLIRQPRWQGRVDTYINALSSNEVPLACKRGRETWRGEEKGQAPRVLGTSRMNLTGGAFDGYESLIEIESKGKRAPLEVTFHIHPLEQEIRDLITSQPTGAGRKLKREGKECWYMPLRSLLPVILEKGYTVEELHKIVEIGKARQTFDVTERRGERVLYCKPLGLEELKAQLRAKLSDLEAEIAEYKQISDYVTHFDSVVMEEAIERIEDDADYDRLGTRMNKEFEQNHSRLPGYFDRVQEKLKQVRNRVKTTSDRVLGSREVAQLALPSATSPWGAALGRYIVPNLEHSVDELRKDSKALLEQIDSYMMRFSFSRQRIPRENLMLLREGWSQANDVESRVGDVHVTARSLMQQLADFNKWGSLLKQSDGVYARLLDLQKDPEHQTKAKALIGEFDQISQQITDFLEVRNVTGLSAHRQYQKDFKDLEKERQQYLASLKGSFDKFKDRVNQFLMGFKLDGRVRVVFNPGDIAGCYDQLFSEGANLITEQALDQALGEITTQERELMYARDVLQIIEPETAAPLLTDLKERSQAIEVLKGKVDRDWLHGLVEDDDQEQEHLVAQEIAVSFESVRKTRRTVRKVTRPTEPKSGRAREMYEIIPEHHDIDLKDLVLQMMVQISDSSQALDVSLESLADLFKRNCIQIKVERRYR